MSSIILLRTDHDHLRGRGILLHEGRLFQRDLPSRQSVEAILSGEAPDVIITACYSEKDEVDTFIQKLSAAHPAATLYLVGSHLDPEMVTRAIGAGAREVFAAPIESEELLIHVLTGLGSAAHECAIDPLEWDACCSLLHPEETNTGAALSGADDDLEEALVRLEAERQELELERQLLAEERTHLVDSGGACRPSEEKIKELERRASDLEEQRYEFEEQKVFLMDAQREVEAARLAWEEERSNLEKSNEELLKQLATFQEGGASVAENGRKPDGSRGWLRSSIGSLPLAKGGRNQNGALTASEIRELSGRLNAATEARRGLEAELEEVARSAAQARARQVELEEEVTQLRARYERTGGGGTVSGGSLLERLERLSEKHAAFRSDLQSARDRRSSLNLQIETLASELSGQEISEALTPAHLQRIREVKNQRNQLQETEASLALEESHLIEDLEQNDRELLMIESWIDELEAAREQIARLKRARNEKAPAPIEPKSTPMAEDKKEPAATEKEPAKPITHPPRKRKGGLSRRFALRGMA